MLLFFAKVDSNRIFNGRFDLDYVIWEIIVEWLILVLLLMMMGVIVIMVPALNIFFH